MERNKEYRSGRHKSEGQGRRKFAFRRKENDDFSTLLNLDICIENEWKAFDFINIIEIIFSTYNLILLARLLEKYESRLKGEIFNLPELFTQTDKEFEVELKKSIYQFTELPDSPNLHDIIKHFPEEYQLSIKKIQYNSPGSIDFLGIGEIIKQIKEFIISLTTIKSDYNLKKLEIEEKKEDIREKKIRNLDKTLEIFKKYNLPSELFSDISNSIEVDSRIIKELSQENKITGIEIK